MRKDYDLVGSYDNQRVSTISAERTVNLFEYIDPNGKRPKALLPTSGLRNANLNFGSETGGARATFVFNNAIYQVFGSSIFRTTGTKGFLFTTLIGNLTTSTGYVGIDANTFQVIFVDGVAGYIWDTNASTFQQITDTRFPARPIDVCYLDGFFLVAHGDTNAFQLSSLNQGMVWSGGSATFTANSATDILTLSSSNANFATGIPVTVSTTGTLPSPLAAGTTYFVIRIGSSTTNPGTIRLATSYANAIAGVAIDLTTNGAPTNTILVSGQVQEGFITSHPGTIVGCRTLHRRIFLFSQNFTEVWENAGLGTNLPFRRNNSLLMEVGTPAVGSISVGFDRMFFLSQDKDGLAGVMEVRGTESILVSNRALDFQLAQYAEDPLKGVSDARGVLIKENGLIFYRLNFTRANHTFVLNVSMSTTDSPRWHEEEVLNGDRHPAQTHAYFEGVNYYGAYDRPIFYIVDDQESTNDGEAIRRMRIGRQMSPEGYNRLRIDRFQVDLLQGDEDIDEFIDVDLLAENFEELLTESGVNIILDQQIKTGGGQPTVFLAVSKDGGQTYGNYIHASMGKIGERTHRTVWRKLGTTPRGQGFTPKIEFFNEIPFVVLGAAWDFEILPE
ncbi:TPA: hypothetical protein ACPSKZ_000682 [Legionella anisa]|uniref:hypothetical protein n=1 Tax=Legionella anisa TaxID=28082 RepID=UPI0022439C36|nr:hypothetical protein [Legionella anisa]MCW8425620.1 hypothetical protein [Legionella anisa]MCW8448951.1 hypothetical protein [Legionella anisa]